jgi:hypothetical protein
MIEEISFLAAGFFKVLNILNIWLHLLKEGIDGLLIWLSAQCCAMKKETLGLVQLLKFGNLKKKGD